MESGNESENLESSLWSFRSICLHSEHKTATLDVICKGKRFFIALSPEIFDQTPDLLQKYLKLIEDVNNKNDFDIFYEAEQDLQDWVMEPFLEVFEKLEPPSSQKHVTLQDYFTPETYRYQIYGQDGTLQPFLDHNMTSPLISDGITIDQSKLSSNCISFLSKDIKIELPTIDESLSQTPRKVSVGGTLYHFKPVYGGNRSATLREISIYKRLDELFSRKEIRAPLLHRVVREETGSLVIRLLLSWIECRSENSYCILGSEVSDRLKEKWRLQIVTVVTKLHEAGIIWGDAKAANILIDTRDDDAWLIDFGGGYTEGWVERSQMDTIEGDLAGLAKIEELLQPEKKLQKRGLEDSDETHETKKPYEVRVDSLDC